MELNNEILKAEFKSLLDIANFTNSDFITSPFRKEFLEYVIAYITKQETAYNELYEICESYRLDNERLRAEGEWIAKDNFNGRCSIANCSNCGVEKAFSVLVNIETITTLYPFCQKCGAKMRQYKK